MCYVFSYMSSIVLLHQAILHRALPAPGLRVWGGREALKGKVELELVNGVGVLHRFVIVYCICCMFRFSF